MLMRYNETSKINEIVAIVNTVHKEFFIKTKIINHNNVKEILYSGASIRMVVTELDDN
jgi:hypothetical protein